MRLKLRAPRATRLATLAVYVDGRRRAVVKGRSLPGVVWVRRLPARRFEVKLRAVTRAGGWQWAARTYKRCRAPQRGAAS